MSIKALQAVIFDMDGVIFDSERYVIECWKIVGEKYHIPDIEKMCLECTGINATLTKKKMLDHYGQDFPYEKYREEERAIFQSKVSGGRLPVKKGARELLAFLKEKGIKVALASSTRKEVVHKELAEANLIDYFDAIICGDMVKKSKPEPDIFLAACEALGVSPKDCIGIEDSHNGVRACHSAKLFTIMVPDLMPVTSQMKELANMILPDLCQVEDFINRRISEC